jgi:surface antigen
MKTKNIILIGCLYLAWASQIFAIGIGDRVAANGTVNVRPTPAGTPASGQQTSGSLGVVIGGPSTATLSGTSYTWYDVNFDTGVDGWVADSGSSIGLTVVAPSAPTQVAPGYSSGSPGQQISTLTPTITWNAALGATGYGVYVEDLGNSVLVYNNDSVGNVTQITLPSGTLVAGHNYVWNMRSSDSAGYTYCTTHFYFYTQSAPAPSISSVSPNPITADANDNPQTLTINGANFVSKPTVVVTWTKPSPGSATLSSSEVSFISSSQLTMTIQLDKIADNWTVKATNPDGQSSSAVGFVVNAPVAPAPSISSVSPNPITADAANGYQTLTINGANFVNNPTLVLTWTGQSGYTLPASRVTYVSSSQLTMSIHLGAAADNWTVKATNPDNQSSSAFGFQVLAPNSSGCSFSDTYPYPAANIYNPNNPSDPSTIDPWNFYNRECTSYIAWKLNQAAGTTTTPYFFFNSMQGGHWGDAGNWSANATALGYTVNATPAVGAIAQWNAGEPGGGTEGHVAFVVEVNSDGTVAVSEYNYHLDHNFDVRCSVTPPRFLHIHDASIAPPPSLSSVVPNPITADANDNPQTLSINGANFVSKPTVVVTWTKPSPGSATLGSSEVSFISSSQLTMTIQLDKIADNWTVKVTNPDGQSSGAIGFVVNTPVAPAPSISSVSPNPVTGSNSHQTITIYGANFVNSPTLTLTWTVPPVPPSGGYIVPSGEVTFVSSTELQMSIDTTTAADNWTVKVQNPDGQMSSTLNFTVTNPVVAGAQPGIDYSVYGNGGTATTGVNISGIKAAGKQFVGEYIGATDNYGYLRSSDVTVLTSQGLQIVSLFERNPTSASYFTLANADYDAADAINAASLAGQQSGSAIYFTVDYAASSPDISAIDNYFREIRLDFNTYFGAHPGTTYKIGVYAPGNVLPTIMGDASVGASYSWLADPWGIYSYSSENLEQTQDGVVVGGINADLDEAYTADFGQWGGSSSSPQPIFGGSSVSGGKLQTTLSGLSSGQTVVIYSSTDLKNWTPIQTNNAVTGSTLTVTNTINPAMKSQYFRATVQ